MFGESSGGISDSAVSIWEVPVVVEEVEEFVGERDVRMWRGFEFSSPR